MTCRELIDFIGDYLDDELAPAMRAEFERHLRACPSCVAYLDAYKQAMRLGRLAVAPSEDAAPAPEGLIRAIRASRRTKG